LATPLPFPKTLFFFPTLFFPLVRFTPTLLPCYSDTASPRNSPPRPQPLLGNPPTRPNRRLFTFGPTTPFFRLVIQRVFLESRASSMFQTPKNFIIPLFSHSRVLGPFFISHYPHLNVTEVVQRRIVLPRFYKPNPRRTFLSTRTYSIYEFFLPSSSRATFRFTSTPSFPPFSLDDPPRDISSFRRHFPLPSREVTPRFFLSTPPPLSPVVVVMILPPINFILFLSKVHVTPLSVSPFIFGSPDSF